VHELDPLQIRFQLLQSSIPVLAWQDEDQVQQMLERRLIQQRLDVRTL
jgi:hypothetical protein